PPCLLISLREQARRPVATGIRVGIFLVWIGLGALAAPSLRAELPRVDVIVAADGSGKFTSLQEAISTAPMQTNPKTPWVILVKSGTYKERIYVQRERGNIRVIGEDAEK